MPSLGRRTDGEAVPIQYKWTVLTVTTVGVLMAGIDSRIVIVGLPQVAASLGADAERAIWITQAYVLGSTVALLLIGRLSDIVGRVKIYTAGFAVFTVGSLLTSLSVNPTMMIACRGLQGLGSGIMFTNSAAIITDATPPNELGFSLGINQVAFRVGAMTGLTVSGLILTFLDWRALFYVNIPIGIAGTLWARRRLREVAGPERGAPMDWLGFVTFTTGIGSLLLALTMAAYGIAERGIVAALVAIAGIALSLFILVERRTPHPLLDLKLLRIREFMGGVVAQLLNAIAFGAVLLLMSLYLQLVRDLSPLAAGLLFIPLDIATIILGPISGKLSDRHGHRPFTTGGLALVSLSLFLLATMDAFTPYPVVVLYLVIFGAGLGIFASPNISSIMGSVPSGRRGVASGVRATFFNVGFTISLNLAVLLMTLTVPYGLVTQILTSGNPATIPPTDRILFADGLQKTFLALAAINTTAIIPSFLRGRRSQSNREAGTDSASGVN